MLKGIDSPNFSTNDIAALLGFVIQKKAFARGNGTPFWIFSSFTWKIKTGTNL